MNRYNRSLFGMNKSETGEWVAYPIFELLQTKCLENDDLAEQRLDIIHERNSTIILKQKEVEEIHIKYQKLVDGMNTHNILLEEVLKQKDEELYNMSEKNTSLYYSLEESKKKLNIQSKFSDIKHDIFIFSAVLNAILSLTMAAMYFGGV